MDRAGSSHIASLMQVQFDFNRNKYFDTKEAVEYGIIDQVSAPHRHACAVQSDVSKGS